MNGNDIDSNASDWNIAIAIATRKIMMKHFNPTKINPEFSVIIFCVLTSDSLWFIRPIYLVRFLKKCVYKYSEAVENY